MVGEPLTRKISPKMLEAHKATFKGNQGLLLPPMQRYVLRKVAEEADNTDRRSDIMHPSEMCKPDWCPRRDFYRITLGDRKDTDTRFTSELIFAEGHTIHDKYQSWLWGMGILYGRWRCSGCGHTWMDTSPVFCPNCELENRIHYREVPLEDTDLMIAGHADGGVLKGAYEWVEVLDPVLIEVKSIGMGTVRVEDPALHRRYMEENLTLEDVWREIKRPFPAHIRQATLYCWLTKGMFTRMVFIYESKWNQQTKEFVVVPDFRHIKWLLDSAKDVAQGVRAGIEPYRPGWAVPDHKTCKACAFKKECWGNDQEDQPVPQPAVRRAAPARRRKALRPTGVRPA